MHRGGIERMAAAKWRMLEGSPGGYLLLSVLVGVYVGFGIALTLVVFAGSELFTGNDMVGVIGGAVGDGVMASSDPREHGVLARQSPGLPRAGLVGGAIGRLCHGAGGRIHRDRRDRKDGSPRVGVVSARPALQLAHLSDGVDVRADFQRHRQDPPHRPVPVRLHRDGLRAQRCQSIASGNGPLSPARGERQVAGVLAQPTVRRAGKSRRGRAVRGRDVMYWFASPYRVAQPAIASERGPAVSVQAQS